MLPTLYLRRQTSPAPSPPAAPDRSAAPGRSAGRGTHNTAASNALRKAAQRANTRTRAAEQALCPTVTCQLVSQPSQAAPRPLTGSMNSSGGSGGSTGAGGPPGRAPAKKPAVRREGAKCRFGMAGWCKLAGGASRQQNIQSVCIGMKQEQTAARERSCLAS